MDLLFPIPVETESMPTLHSLPSDIDPSSHRRYSMQRQSSTPDSSETVLHMDPRPTVIDVA
ncbi:MAG: hypothetical protein AB8B63_08610 [Granulosicoccus sp.]